MRAKTLAVFTAAVVASFAAAATENEPGSPQTSQAAPNAAAKGPAPPPSVTVIGARDAHGVLGREVRSPANEDMGRIVDVIVDRDGVVRAAVIDFGGFLGVGSRKIAVDWKALHFVPAATTKYRIVLELSQAQVKAAPEFKEGKPIVVLGTSGNLEPLP